MDMTKTVLIGICLLLGTLSLSHGQNTTTTTATTPITTSPTTTQSTTTASTTTASTTTASTTTATTTTTPTTTASTTTQTTTAPTTTPTTAPSTTSPTTPAPATNTTTPAAPTTTPASTVSPDTPASTNTYELKKDANDTCILVVMQAAVSKGSDVINITDAYTVDEDKSSCSDAVSTLVIASGDNTLTMTFVSDNTSYSLTNVLINVGGIVGNVSNADANSEIKTSVGSSYKCSAHIKLSDAANVTLETWNLQMQAFQFGAAGKFDTAILCAYDMGDNIVIPLAVGCALGGLIIIILIAYFIGRRRVKHHYEAM